MGLASSTISRVTGVDVAYKNFNTGAAAMLPQRLAIIGQGNDTSSYSLDKYECEGSAAIIGDKYGYGSPLHLAALQLFPMIGKTATFPVTIYPVVKTDSAIAAAGKLVIKGTATAGGSGIVRIGGIEAQFSVAKDESATNVITAVKNAINSVIQMPVIAVEAVEAVEAAIDITAKWSGEVGNQIKMTVATHIPGILFEVTDIIGGVGKLNVSPTLSNIATVWETFILSCGNYADSEILEKYFLWGEDRWGAFEKKPALVAHGCTDEYATRTAITDLRKTDYINFLIVSVGSDELPFSIAAKGLLSDIMTTADSNPAQGYKGLLSGLAAGADSAQEEYLLRNNSVTKGSSTNIKNGSIAELNDIITMYHPESEGKYPSKRYVVDMVKLMNVVYNVRLIMESDELKAAPLVSDETITSNPAAVQPKTIKTYFANLADSLADKAIIQEAKFTKENLLVAIDSENPKRLNTKFPIKLSGNVEVISNEIFFGFYLGGN